MFNPDLHPMFHFNVPECHPILHFLQLSALLRKTAVKQWDFEQNLNPGLTTFTTFCSSFCPRDFIFLHLLLKQAGNRGSPPVSFSEL